jgi:hypothetical protein
VHVGNYPTLITEFASVKVHLICNQLSKIWWKKTSGFRKKHFFSFFTCRAQWVTM